MHPIGRWIFRSLVYASTRGYSRLAGSDRRTVLLCCNDPLMIDYLVPFWELFRHDPRLRVYVTYPVATSVKLTEDRIRYMHERLPFPTVSPRWAWARAWDLVVCADHCLDVCLRSPVILIGHGAPGKAVPGETTEYAFGKAAHDAEGRLIYQRIFVGRDVDAARAIAGDPHLKDIVAVVGNLENDRVLEQDARRAEFRQAFGFQPTDTVVFVLSTWGEHCLWHTMGDALLEEFRKPIGSFRFVLSAHPHEYRAKPNGERVWGEYLRSQKQYGFIVREPSESWIPYLVASDMVLSDYTNLVQAAVLLRKRILLTPVPEEVIWQGSITAKVRQFAPILRDARTLHQCLRDTIQNYPFGRLHDLAQSVHPYPGQAADRIRSEIYSLLRIPAPPK